MTKYYNVKTDKLRNLVGLLIEYDDNGETKYLQDQMSPDAAMELANELIHHAKSAER